MLVPDVEKREPLRGELAAIEQGQVDEPVADGEQPQRADHHQQPGEPGVRDIAPAHAWTWLGPKTLVRLSRAVIRDQQDQQRDPGHCRAQRGQHHRRVAAGDQPQDGEGHQGTDRRTDRVQRAMHPEGASQLARGGDRGDHRVARRRPHALADAVGRHDSRDGGQPGGEEQEDARDTREAVADQGDPLGVTRPVGGHAGADPHDRADPLVDPVHEAVGDRRKAHDAGEVERQDRGDRLRGHVGQEADEAQGDHHTGDPTLSRDSA